MWPACLLGTGGIAMPKVSAEVLVDAPLDTVYKVAKDIERFPDFMEDVESVEILERRSDGYLSRWVGVVKEFNRRVTWTEEDHWDDDSHVCTFKQVDGDFSSYGGTWKFEPAGEQTRMTLEVEYEYNVPLIGALIKGLLQRKMEQNCRSMLEAIKRKAEELAQGQ